MLRSLVGSEMCIRDRSIADNMIDELCKSFINSEKSLVLISNLSSSNYGCLLYTSDAADEEDSVDLGGRRIIKKKRKHMRTLHKKITQQTNT